jgi:hypothetical protein
VAPDVQLECRRCGGPLHGRDGRFILKYFLMDHPVPLQGFVSSRRSTITGYPEKSLVPPGGTPRPTAGAFFVSACAGLFVVVLAHHLACNRINEVNLLANNAGHRLVCVGIF